jgi:hypothetical protein
MRQFNAEAEEKDRFAAPPVADQPLRAVNVPARTRSHATTKLNLQ